MSRTHICGLFSGKFLQFCVEFSSWKISCQQAFIGRFFHFAKLIIQIVINLQIELTYQWLKISGPVKTMNRQPQERFIFHLFFCPDKSIRFCTNVFFVPWNAKFYSLDSTCPGLLFNTPALFDVNWPSPTFCLFRSRIYALCLMKISGIN